MTLRAATLILLILLGSYAAAGVQPDLSTTESGRDALVRFNLTQQFLDKPGDEAGFRGRLSEHCDTPQLRKCVTFLKQNKQAVLAALPNNPEYWHAFHELLRGPPAEFDATQLAYDDPSRNKSKLIDASNGWVYRAIAENRFHLATDEFVRYYQDIRRHMSESTTLIDRMIFTAMVGIAHRQIEMLMALLAAQGDLGSIRTLAAQLTPFSEQERSLRKTFQGEARYMQASIENATEINPDDFPNLVIGDINDLKARVQQNSRREMEKITQLIGEVTERNWSDYWGQGFSYLENETSDVQSNVFFYAPAYRSYARTSRSSEVPIYPLQALGDLYLGLTSPGLPARSPPVYWNWSWSVASQKICLVPTHAAPNTADFTIDAPACVTYLGEVAD